MPSLLSPGRASAVVFLCAIVATSCCGLAAEKGGTRVVEDSSGVFSVAFPETSTQSGGLGKSASEEQQQFTLSTDQGVYMLVYEDFPKLDFSDDTVAASAMQTAREGFRKSLNGELISEQKIRLPGTGVNGVEFCRCRRGWHRNACRQSQIVHERVRVAHCRSRPPRPTRTH